MKDADILKKQELLIDEVNSLANNFTNNEKETFGIKSKNKIKYRRLFAEMYVRGITSGDLAKLLNLSTKAISNRINGKISFTCAEVLVIMNTYFKNESIDYIFSDGSEKCYGNKSCS